MKRVFAIVLAVLLLAGSLSVPAMAADEAGNEAGGVSVTLQAINLELSEYLYLWAGIHLEGVEYDSTAKNAGVIFWREEQTDYTYDKAVAAAAAGKAVISDVACDLATVDGVSIIGFPCAVAAKQMADVFYLQGYVKVGEKYYYSDKVEPYSVVKYAQYQLYKNAEASNELKECLLAMLDYGATAQKLFKYNTDNLANEAYYSKGLKYTVSGDSCILIGLDTCTDTEIFVPYKYEGVPVIKVDGAIKNWSKDSNVTSFAFPYGMLGVDLGMFSQFKKLENVFISSTVESIECTSFAMNTPRDYTITISAANERYTVEGNCVIDNSDKENRTIIYGVKDSVIPSDITKIADKAFYGDTSLKSITIPAGLTSIGKQAFYACSGVTAITVAEGNNVYRSAGNCLIETDSKTLITGCRNSEIPEDVTSIESGAFRNCIGLESIKIPAGVTSIGSFAFRGCGGVTSITVDAGNIIYESAGNCLIKKSSKQLMLGCSTSEIPTDGSVTRIGTYAFEGCYIPMAITIPDNITSISNYAFYNCSGLVGITIPNSVTSIGNYAFCKCNNLWNITIPNSVKSIGQSAFYGCSSSLLTSVEIPDTVTTISATTFCQCSSLKSITLPHSVTKIDTNAFTGCSSLTDINFNGTQAEWESITKANVWDTGTPSYTIHCTDGDITK